MSEETAIEGVREVLDAAYQHFDGDETLLDEERQWGCMGIRKVEVLLQDRGLLPPKES